eukprot:PhM_4_TR9413/c1_g1_i1/m.47733
MDSLSKTTLRALGIDITPRTVDIAKNILSLTEAGRNIAKKQKEVEQHQHHQSSAHEQLAGQEGHEQQQTSPKKKSKSSHADKPQKSHAAKQSVSDNKNNTNTNNGSGAAQQQQQQLCVPSDPGFAFFRGLKTPKILSGQPHLSENEVLSIVLARWSELDEHSQRRFEAKAAKKNQA